MRYLLDELMAYEEGFTDILMVDRNSERHETFMGSVDTDASITVTKGDLHMFEANLLQRVEVLMTPRHRELHRELHDGSELSPVSGTPIIIFQHTKSNFIEGIHGETVLLNSSLAVLGLRTPSSTPHRTPAYSISTDPPIFTTQPSKSPSPMTQPSKIPSLMTQPSKIPRSVATPFAQGMALQPSISTLPSFIPPRIPATHTLDDVIRYWEVGDSSKGLNIPLCGWMSTFDSKQYRTEAQKFSMIEKVYNEYAIHCNHDDSIFDSQYPGLRTSYTKLVIAVRAARIERGDTKARQPRKRRRVDGSD